MIPLPGSTKGVTMGSRTGPETIASQLTMARVGLVNRRIRRGRDKRSRHDGPQSRPLPAPAAAVPACGPDPVRIAVLAMESLGRASMRASFTGTEVRVGVPDAATAAIFQAAIAETGRTRPTDRLIRIVVD
jgi:hypothetical protein